MMKNNSIPTARRLVLLGGGHTHALFLRMLAMDPLPGVETILVSDVVHAPYSGMLPGLIAGFYEYDEAHIDLGSLTGAMRIPFVHAKATGIEPEEKKVLFENRPPLGFDLLSINIGITPKTKSVPGASEYGIPSKPVQELLSGWQRVLEDHRQGHEPKIVIVGGGAGGVELSFCFHRRLEGKTEIDLIDRGEILGTHNQRVKNTFRKEAQRRGIRFHEGEEVERVEEGKVLCKEGKSYDFDYLFWVVSASGAGWLKETGLDLQKGRFIRIKPTLQTTSHSHIFAAGDITAFEGQELAKAGVYAVRMSGPLNQNLRRYFFGQKLVEYSPQKKFLALIGTADGKAVASWRSLSWHSKLMWKWKDHIDTKFMNKFHHLPDELEKMSQKGKMPEEKVEDAIPPARELEKKSHLRCGGCAAKVPADILTRSLQRLPQKTSVDVEGEILFDVSSGDDGAAFALPEGKILVQSVDHITAIVKDHYLFGKIAVHHSLSDLYAMGARPHSLQATVLVPFAASQVSEEEIYQLTRGIVEAAEENGARLVGGHTAENPELALGILANGLASREEIVAKKGLEKGQVLILTKPLGIGALFAAHMRGKARGRWVAGAIESMLTSNGPAMEVFHTFQARPVTDITGFGLVGHLLEMVGDSPVSLKIEIEKVPALEGVREVFQKGIFSTLHPANNQVENRIENSASYSSNPRYPLLFDPQTSGGLLAAVDKEKGEDCLKALHQEGYSDSAIIGEVWEKRDSAIYLS